MIYITVFDEDIPVMKDTITVVTEDEDKSGVVIQDYLNGKPVGNELYVGYDLPDSSVLSYPYKKSTAYVEYSVQGKFNLLIEDAKLWEECDRDIDRYSAAVEERLYGSLEDFED